MSRIPAHILELPAADRLEIAQEIWESIVAHPEALPISEAQRTELERRWLALQESPDEGEPWEEVEQSLLRE